MQNWFFLEDPSNTLLRNKIIEQDESRIPSIQSILPPRPWHFRVRVSDLRKEEVVGVIGDCEQLGCWLPEKAVELVQEDNPEIWSRIIQVPSENVKYRFFVYVIVENGIQVIVRSWEANLKPRSLELDSRSPTSRDLPLEYGVYDNTEHIDRGWLLKETIIHLKLCNNPLTLWRPKFGNRKTHIKVTPVGLLHSSGTNVSRTMSEALEDSLSADTQDSVETPRFACTEAASLNAEDPSFKPQPQFGVQLLQNDMLIFQSTVLFPANVAFLIDIYVYSAKTGEGEPPHHAGFSYLLPSVLQSSEGSVVLPVTSTKHRPLGEIRIEFLVVKPMSNFKCDMDVSYARHWKKTRAGLDVGHRGSGSSFKTHNCAEVRENTVASLKNAIDHGADYVEFDVQLSKDLVPIVYHDFHVCISLKNKKQLDDTEMLEIPVKELTLERLQLLKVYHLTEGKTKNPRFFDDDLEDHQPFPTLKHILDVLNPHVGFNIEIKWTMQLQDGSYELYHPTDLNLYLDTILEVVLRYGNNRRVVFSCFNPDICAVIRLKQNKYPVMFLTVGDSHIYPRYIDPRCWTVPAATQYATMIQILGINVHTADLLREPSLVQFAKRNGLIVFCWGDENADPTTIKFLKELGLHGVIYDKIYQYSSKEVKESIFLVEARESQKELIRLAAANSLEQQSLEQQQQQQQPQHEVSATITKDQHILDVERVRRDLGDHLSTATSYDSLASSCADYETNGGIC